MLRDIVLVHGGGQGAWVWAETIAAIRVEAGATAGRIFCLNVPGCGDKRGQDTTGMSIPDVIDELASELDANNVSDALLVGHSQAGTLLPGLCAARSDRIARAVYFTCAAPDVGQTVVQMMGGGIHGSHQREVGWPRDPATTSSSEMFHAGFCNDMDEKQSRTFAAKLGMDHWPTACATEWSKWHYDSGCYVPVTYVLALADNILPLAWQERFAARLNASRLVRLDCGHQGMNTRPYSLAEILIEEARVPYVGAGH